MSAGEHHPRCLCWTCERLPSKLAQIERLRLRELTARGDMDGVTRHWMEQARADEEYVREVRSEYR